MALMFTEFSAEPFLVFGAVFLTSYFVYQRRNGGDTGRKLPPAMRSLPIVGSIPFLPRSKPAFAEFCVSPENKLGNIFSFRLGSK